jgi:hypothetical protein
MSPDVLSRGFWFWRSKGSQNLPLSLASTHVRKQHCQWDTQSVKVMKGDFIILEEDRSTNLHTFFGPISYMRAVINMKAMQCLFLGQHVLHHWLSNKFKEVINLLDQCSWARYLILNPHDCHDCSKHEVTHTTLLKGSWLCSMDTDLGTFTSFIIITHFFDM